MRCATCGKTITNQDLAKGPFCSDRCREVDLGRWLDERYAFPTERELSDDAYPQDGDGDEETY